MDRMLRETIPAASLRLTSSFASGGMLASRGSFRFPFLSLCFRPPRLLEFVFGLKASRDEGTRQEDGATLPASFEAEDASPSPSTRKGRENWPAVIACGRRVGEEERKRHLTGLAFGLTIPLL